MQTLDYYFDFLSPYSYLSWQVLKGYLPEWREKGIQIRFNPVTLASIIHFHETKGPAEIRPKRLYLFKDCLRFSKMNDILFTIPKELPFNSLYALRCSLKENAGDLQEKVIDTFFMASWGEGRDIGQSEGVLEILENAGLPGEKLLEKSMSVDCRKALKNNVKEAQRLNLFGLPSFIFSGELFWGNDSIPHLDNFIKGKDPVDPELVKKFEETYEGDQ